MLLLGNRHRDRSIFARVILRDRSKWLLGATPRHRTDAIEFPTNVFQKLLVKLGQCARLVGNLLQMMLFDSRHTVTEINRRRSKRRIRYKESNQWISLHYNLSAANLRRSSKRYVGLHTVALPVPGCNGYDRKYRSFHAYAAKLSFDSLSKTSPRLE